MTSTSANAPVRRGDLLAAVAPGLFVLLWSTGFIGAKFGLPYAPPLTFLALRYALVAGLIGAVALLWRAPWPQRPRDYLHIAVAGLLVHAGYLGGVFVAISKGLPAGVTALVTGLQPLLTAAAAALLLGETVARRQWTGLILGLAGVTLVVWNKVSFEAGLGGFPFAVLAVACITAGTLYQKRHCGGMDLRSGAAIQYVAAFAATLPLALLTEDMDIAWTGEFVFAMSWLVLVLSVGAITLLYRLIRAGSASRVASLFYLVPPTVAVISFFLFGETLGPVALVGMGLTVVGVALATRS
jgi:drug/metabolite transporter (DMT)-like permease